VQSRKYRRLTNSSYLIRVPNSHFGDVTLKLLGLSLGQYLAEELALDANVEVMLYAKLPADRNAYAS
jgi:hypothetical protein